MLTPRGTKLSTRCYQTHDAASCRTASPTHYRLSYSDSGSFQKAVVQLPGAWRDRVGAVGVIASLA